MSLRFPCYFFFFPCYFSPISFLFSKDVFKFDTFSLLKTGDHENLEGHTQSSKQKSWADEIEETENQDPTNRDKMAAGPSNVIGDTAAEADAETLPLNPGNDIKDLQEENTKDHSQGKDTSSLHEFTNDSSNTSDLSPTKVFASKDEGWQEVQSKKKKKAVQAQSTRPTTRSSKTLPQ